MNRETLISAIAVATFGLTGVLATRTSPVSAELNATPTAISTSAAARDTAANALPDASVRRFRTVTIPAGTVLPVTLDSYVASDSSRIEDPVRAHLRRAIVIDGETLVPAGSAVNGYVTSAVRSARVKGRARLAFRFSRLAVPDSSERVAIRTSSVSRIAPATKGQDALKIGIPAAGGAIIGALAGGKKGAAIGAAAGGGGGTAVVLSTRGKEVRLGRGYATSVRLLEPVTLRISD
jgi:hypothetical protein